MNKKYYIQSVNDNYIVFASSYIGPSEYLSEIDKELSARHYNGVVFFDLLMCNGFSSNRYMQAVFNGNRTDVNSFESLKEVDSKIKGKSNTFFRKNIDLLEKSPIPHAQKWLFKRELAKAH